MQVIHFVLDAFERGEHAFTQGFIVLLSIQTLQNVFLSLVETVHIVLLAHLEETGEIGVNELLQLGVVLLERLDDCI